MIDFKDEAANVQNAQKQGVAKEVVMCNKHNILFLIKRK